MILSRAFWEKAQAIDRRWIFLMIVLAVIIPMTSQCTVRSPATPEVRAIFDRVEQMAPGSRVLLALDFDPPSEPELLPMAMSYTRHLALRGHRIYFMTLWPVGQQEVERVILNVLNAEFPEYEYGVDYLSLGYKTGGQGVIQGVLSDFRRQYPTDAHGTAVARLPIFQGVQRLADMDLILNVSAGYPGIKEWVQFGGDQSRVPVAGGVTAVSAPLLYPYYPKQLFGLMGGMQAASEYETLLQDHYPERYAARACSELTALDLADEPCRAEGFGPPEFPAMKRMGPQTFAHLVIVLFILIGNIGYFATRRGAGGRLRSVR
jgi:hypothetical protein